ncbi:MAG: hypothetical protein ABI351_09090, partial [Herbaspirillum sp.]
MPNCDTLVQYMGGCEVAASARKLLATGCAADTPLVLLKSCSRSDQRVLLIQLAELEWMNLYWSGPALMLIGTIMAHRNKAHVFSIARVDQRASAPNCAYVQTAYAITDRAHHAQTKLFL